MAERPGSFLAALGLGRGDVVCLIGAGGKTSLMFRLAAEAREHGMQVLVTTSTRIMVPEEGEYDFLDLSGKLFANHPPQRAGIYVGGTPDTSPDKMRGVREDLLDWQRRQFDLVLIEADGAAGRALKGWRADEPVLPDCTSVTVGVLDIRSIGRIFCESTIHRPEIFSALTGAEPGETLRIGHLLRLIAHEEGLFARSLGREILYINKVESATDKENTEILRDQLENLAIVSGSVKEGMVYG